MILRGTASTQLILELAPRPAYGRENFLVADCNREAVTWLDRWPDWPGPALIVHGPEGCGKSHLAQSFVARSGGRLAAAADLRAAAPDALLENVPAVVIDDLEAVLGADAGEALLHLFNVAREQGRHLLLTAGRPPARLPIPLPDLRSRLVAAAAVGIAAPDDAMLRAVLVKLFADRQVSVEESLVSFLLARIERSFDAARRIVDQLDRYSLATGRPITVPLARAALAGAGDGDLPVSP